MKVFLLGGLVRQPSSDEEIVLLSKSCTNLGRSIRKGGHELIVCSPFKDSADYFAVSGFASSRSTSRRKVFIHYPNIERVDSEVQEIKN